MNHNGTDAYLSQIRTHWSQILRAQQGQQDEAGRARGALLVRYHEAVYRYLLARLGDAHAADQVWSEFAVRVLEGHEFLKRATPGPSSGPRPGRFRYYLKVVLSRMVADYYRARQKEQRFMPQGPRDDALDGVDPRAAVPGAEDPLFQECWRQELVNRAWEALEETERRTGRPYATVLRLRQVLPTLPSHQMAEKLTHDLGRPFSAAGVRQLLHRGRELMGQLLVQEVARSLQTTPNEPVAPQEIEQELIDFGLFFSFTQSALQRLRNAA